MAAWGQTNWIDEANTDWYDDNSGDTEFIISTAEELAGLAKLVNGGNDFSGKTFKLGNDIQLNNTSDWESWETTPPENLWTPIGVLVLEPTISEDYYFCGTFDGQGHTIRGIYINTSDQFHGLFGLVDDSGKIQNLTVAESYICGEVGFVGGIVGQGSGTVSNCSNSGTVSGDDDAAGIVGLSFSNGTVSNCYYLESTCENGIGQDDSNQSANVKVKSEAEYKSGEVLLLLDITREIWGQDFDKGYPVPLGSLSEEDQAAY